MCTPINRAQLLTDVKAWLPEGNVLPDSQISTLIDYVVENEIPEDCTEKYYAEALCKSLKAVAVANKSKYSVDQAGKRREEVGLVEVEYFEAGTKDPWAGFIDSLKDLCPLFGYTPESNSVIGIKINAGDKPDPLACCNTKTSDLHL